MKILIDKDHGIICIRIKEEKVRTARIGDTLMIDYDENEEVVGIEILDEAIKDKLEIEV